MSDALRSSGLVLFLVLFCITRHLPARLDMLPAQLNSMKYTVSDCNEMKMTVAKQGLESALRHDFLGSTDRSIKI